MVGKASILRSSLSYPPGSHIDIKHEEKKEKRKSYMAFKLMINPRKNLLGKRKSERSFLAKPTRRVSCFSISRALFHSCCFEGDMWHNLGLDKGSCELNGLQRGK